MSSSAEEDEEMKLLLSESLHSRSDNLNELIRLHRARNKYELVDKFYNNAYIHIDNPMLQNQLYYYYDILKCYLEDLSLVYFKAVEVGEFVRLEHVLRRLNFTLNGQDFNFREFLVQNRLYQDMCGLFSEEFLEGLEDNSNQAKVIRLRNCMYLCLTLKYLYSFNFQHHQLTAILQQITSLYLELKRKVGNQRPMQETCHERQTRTKSAYHSEKSRCEKNDQDSQAMRQNEQQKREQFREEGQGEFGISFCFDDLLYEQEMSLKIIQINLQNYYFQNQIKDQSTSEQQLIKLQYLYEINKEYLSGLTELRELNNSNRTVVKTIKNHIKIEQQTGNKCFVNPQSATLQSYFGTNLYLQDYHSAQTKLQRIVDADYMQQTLITIINKLKMRQIADSLEKVFEIQRNQHNAAKKCGSLEFSVSFQKGLGVNQVVLDQQQFLKLNQLRQQSMLTSYLTPMKSNNSHISHNVYTYACLAAGQFPYVKQYNNNYEVMRNLRNKISRHRTVGTMEIKEQYYNKFKVCHNCKTLCPKAFLKQCRKKIRNEREWNQSNFESNDDDSLYTEKNYRHCRSSTVNECEKHYCIYCIKNHFNGKLFSEKGQCPFCLDSCHCNSCLRDKMLKKLTNLYFQVGGDPGKVKSYKEMIEGLRMKTQQEQNEPRLQSHSYMEYDERVYETAIKKEITKGFSAEQIEHELCQQKEMASMVLKRQKLKLKLVQSEHRLFRQKINTYSMSFESIDEQAQLDKKMAEESRREQRERDREHILSKLQSKLRRSKRSSKDHDRTAKRRFIRDHQIYYDYYRFDQEDSSDEDSSSFHISLNRSREKKYEPFYNF